MNISRIRIQSRIKSKKLSYLLCIIMIFTFVSPITFSYGDYERVQSGEKAIGDEYIDFMINTIKSNYKYEITEEELYKGAYKGIMDALDKHSVYFDPNEFENFMASSGGEFGGIGITVSPTENGYIDIIAPIEDTPAYRAGIKAGDVIVEISGEDIKDWSIDQAVNVMRGEPGTTIDIGITRSGVNGIINMSIVREIIKINPVKYEIDGDTAYLRITSFNSNTSENVLKALGEFNRKNVKGIVLDLRGNPGGYLDEVLKVAEYFVKPGKELLYVDYKYQVDEVFTSESLPIFSGKPIVVLIDEGSASAAEILSGILKDHGLATLVGEKTYGKGTVQNLLPLNNGGAMKLTIAEYLTPSRNKIDGVGISPNIEYVDPIIITDDEYSNLVPMLENKEYSTLGDTGLNVYGAQQRLKLLGYKVEINGIFDKATKDSIISYQKALGLKTDGILGKTTISSINKRIEIERKDEEDVTLIKGKEILKNIMKSK